MRDGAILSTSTGMPSQGHRYGIKGLDPATAVHAWTLFIKVWRPGVSALGLEPKLSQEVRQAGVGGHIPVELLTPTGGD